MIPGAGGNQWKILEAGGNERPHKSRGNAGYEGRRESGTLGPCARAHVYMCARVCVHARAGYQSGAALAHLQLHAHRGPAGSARDSARRHQGGFGATAGRPFFRLQHNGEKRLHRRRRTPRSHPAAAAGNYLRQGVRVFTRLADWTADRS
jgi:hypothetical protein